MSYVTMIGNVSPGLRGGRHVADIMAALAPPSHAPGGQAVVKSGGGGSSIAHSAMSLLPSVIGAVAGYKLWHKHSVLGALSGAAAAEIGYSYYKGNMSQKAAACGAAVAAAGVVGSLKMKKHPALGYIGGSLIGAIATSFVEGSPSSVAYHKLMNK